MKSSIKSKLQDPMFQYKASACVGALLSILFWVMLFCYGVGTAIVILLITYIVGLVSMIGVISYVS